MRPPHLEAFGVMRTLGPSDPVMLFYDRHCYFSFVGRVFTFIVYIVYFKL